MGYVTQLRSRTYFKHNILSFLVYITLNKKWAQSAKELGIPPDFRTTVFPRIVVATTILFWRLWCDNYSRETTIQRRKLLTAFFFGGVLT